MKQEEMAPGAFLTLSDEELRTQTLRPETLNQAADQISFNGFVVLSNAVAKPLVDRLSDAAYAEVERARAATPPNRGTNRYRLRLPYREPFSDPEVMGNPFILSIAKNLLGEDCVCNYLACDAAMPESKPQNVHSDLPRAKSTFGPQSLGVNITLCDFAPENGAIEIWPGATHLMPGYLAEQEAMGERMPSFQLRAPKGSVLIRDLRVWHRGMPNHTDVPRVNFAMVFSRDTLDRHFIPIGVSRAQYDQLPAVHQSLLRNERGVFASPTRTVSTVRTTVLALRDRTKNKIKSAFSWRLRRVEVCSGS